MKNNNWNCKTKKCLKEEEKPKTKNENKRERREESPQTRALVLLYIFSLKVYKSVLSPSP